MAHGGNRKEEIGKRKGERGFRGSSVSNFSSLEPFDKLRILVINIT
jgi:hypothetical protein